ncbi:hypothetical protein C5167_033180 [Papaver somniferum]|uniref:Uncharacterized protein n=1 Tax=Papaver somniferum TaxID=3469 RepID=A0A4Y7KCH1_PAPSO|nr:hypothetical protein C5167_033180 [Papaver somniferum]
MLLCDSLEIADPRRFEPDIRKFILDIYKVEGKGNWKNFSVGAEDLFMRYAPDKFSTDEGYPYFMDENWFTAESVQNFRIQQDKCLKMDWPPRCHRDASSTRICTYGQ